MEPVGGQSHDQLFLPKTEKKSMRVVQQKAGLEVGSTFSENLRLNRGLQCYCRSAVVALKVLVLNLPAEAPHLCDWKKITTHPSKDECEN